ncbi:hypothetical protein TIFTF001_025473 [Ficus carica]|uniref:Glycosyltransferase n=1 Tax=Ficus carica TaxID=3494 RepID=A0AA88DFK6_FICCA|nr:hypothetical protein TIFTF001_025473 [Ficus carica]
MKQAPPHIAILPSPGVSHQIPFAELARRLVLHHGVHVTIIICSSTDHPPSDATKAVVESLPTPHTRTVFLPPVSFDDLLPTDSGPGAKVALTMSRSLPSIHHVLKSLASTPALTSTSTNSSPPPLVAVFADPFAPDVLDIAKGLDLSTYVFFPSNAMALSFFLHLPKLDEIAAPYDLLKDLPEPVKLPGWPPLRGGDLFGSIQDRRSNTYKRSVQTSKWFVSDEGIKGFVVNSFMDVESEVIKALQEKKAGETVIYPVGPLVQTGQNHEVSECLTWLDNQPRGSVLYVSFGSGGTLSSDQITELAFGLEMSGQRFLWVVRRPNNESANAEYLNSGPKGPLEASDFLPNGFLKRTKGRGLAVPFWAPQAKVLGHGSTGGFLSHCGWNSTLESIVCGVPLIAWPLYAEQKMNAVVLVESLKVALRPKAGEDGLIRREEIAEVIKALMEDTSEEGRIVRNHMKDLKDSATKALSADGSSTRALFELASTLKSMTAN